MKNLILISIFFLLAGCISSKMENRFESTADFFNRLIKKESSSENRLEKDLPLVDEVEEESSGWWFW